MYRSIFCYYGTMSVEPNAFSRTERTRPQRTPKRVSHERDLIYAVIDAAPICHVGFADAEQPFVMPTIHARRGDVLFFHGSTQSRLLRAIASGQAVCVTFTLLDGIVAARSAMHHSMNYRSVVAFGRGRLVDDPEEKWDAYRLTVEKLVPGRWDACRQPNEAEDKATAIAAITIEEASIKQRSGGPIDNESDYEGPHWAGVIPVTSVFGEPIADPRLDTSVALPPHIAQLAGSSVGS